MDQFKAFYVRPKGFNISLWLNSLTSLSSVFLHLLSALTTSTTITSDFLLHTSVEVHPAEQTPPSGTLLAPSTSPHHLTNSGPTSSTSLLTMI